MVGLNLDKLQNLQSRVRKQMHCRGREQDADDASQEYALYILEGKSKHQTIDFFCIDYLRKNVRNPKLKNQFETLSFTQAQFDKSHYVDGAEQIEQEIDYKTIMEMVLAIKNNKHRRIMILYFFSGLTFTDIAYRESLSIQCVFQVIHRSVKRIKTYILPLEAI